MAGIYKDFEPFGSIGMLSLEWECIPDCCLHKLSNQYTLLFLSRQAYINGRHRLLCNNYVFQTLVEEKFQVTSFVTFQKKRYAELLSTTI
ncbi:MAG: hypothetical protein Q8R47_03530 [Nanoarchaeota archaeon]|nr:hypothetical protein [Nanoarchaeota archaeon]